MKDIRVGYGFDVHQLAPGRKCVLGGVQINSDIGPVAHSDGDVLIHAICDALLGAANKRDIGYHFPDTNSRFKDADSTELLKEVVRLISEYHYRIMNVDTTVVTEVPRLSGHIGQMQNRLAECMGIDATRVSIKATTNEKMGFIGRKEGITAHAVVLITR